MLTENDLHRIVKESVNRVLREGEYNFASGTGNYDVNSDEWKTNYDRMSNDYRGQEKKSNSNLMDLQIAHHNGMKGRGGYNGELSKTKQMSPKGKAESIDTIIPKYLQYYRKISNNQHIYIIILQFFKKKADTLTQPR